MVAEHAHEDAARNGFVDLALQLCTEQPFKIVFVAGVLIVLNGMKGLTEPGVDSQGAGAEIVKDVIVKAVTKVEQGIANGEWREVNLLLKLLGSLQGLFEEEGVWTVLDDLFSRAVDLQTASSDDASFPPTFKVLPKLICITDTGYRIGQSHPIHDSLHHGFFRHGLSTKG